MLSLDDNSSKLTIDGTAQLQGNECTNFTCDKLLHEQREHTRQPCYECALPYIQIGEQKILLNQDAIVTLWKPKLSILFCGALYFDDCDSFEHALKVGGIPPNL